MADYESAIDEARERLECARDLLVREIAEYPTPISGCDQQYVRLISDRTRIGNALRVLEDQPFVATPRVLDPVR